jgi:hypothetical protein
MNSILAITSMVLFMGGAYMEDATEQRPEDPQSQQQNTSATKTTNWRTYTNTKFGFKFRYPDHWREANTKTDKANVVWINFSSSSDGNTRNVLYVKVFPDRRTFSLEERMIAGNATATQVTVDKTSQKLYADFLELPTVMISNNDLLVEMGDPSKEGYLKKILGTFRFSK